MVLLKVFSCLFQQRNEEGLSELIKSIKILGGNGTISNWNIQNLQNAIYSTATNLFLKLFEFKEDYDKSDGFLKVPEIIEKNGYPVEIHNIETADGYILEMHRLPRPGAIPIILQHGVLDSSAAWILMGPKQSLGYILYDCGYDVWMGNSRGNTYSRKHKTIYHKSKQFWNFCVDDIAKNDVPSMIDHIIKTTGYKKIHYVGHSQGTAAFLVMCHYKPEYCDKVLSVHFLAPIAYLKHMRSPLVRAFTLALSTLNFLGNVLHVNEILPRTHMLATVGHFFFHERAITQSIFTNILFLVTGYNSEQLNKALVPIIAGHVPNGASRKQLIHYGQLVNSGKFQMYDYGRIRNLIKYGSFDPPSYDLTKVKAPIALYYAVNDWLSDLKDVQTLIEQLPKSSVISIHEIKHPQFNHMDFLFALDAKHFVYDHILEIMKIYENKEGGNYRNDNNFEQHNKQQEQQYQSNNSKEIHFSIGDDDDDCKDYSASSAAVIGCENLQTT